MADSLFMAEASHSVYVNRLASEEVNKLNQFWGGYYRLLQNALGGYDSDMTKRQFNVLIKSIDATITENMEEWQHQLMLDLDEFAEYETDFQARMIGSLTGEDIAVPAPAQVISAAIETPISLGKAGAISLNPWLSDISTKQKQRIESEIKLGYANGRSNADMVRAIVGTRSNKFTDGIADIDRRSAVTLVRTATNHYASTARKKVYEKNKRVVIGHVWVSTLDKRTSDICIGRDGKEYYYDDGEAFYPPAHPNCLLGDTNVTTSSAISNVYKRTYKGVMVDIVTANNRKITITPNHPVLTARGWVAAGEINCLDKVVTMDEISFGDNDEHSINASFEEIFSALDVSVNPSFVTVRPATAEYFHGDGIVDEYVNIVNTDSLGRDAIESIFNKKVMNNRLKLGEAIKLSLNGFGSLLSFFNSGLSSPCGIVGSLGQLGNLFRSGSFHSGELLLTPVSEGAVFGLEKPNDRRVAAIKAKMLMDSVSANAGLVCFNNGFLSGIVKLFDFCVTEGDPVCIKKPCNYVSATAEELPNLVAGELVDGVELDDVISVGFREVDSTHVYNLENDVNWYLSNGIVTHNCRSSTSPIVKGRKPIPDNSQRASKGGELKDGKLITDPKPVSSKLTYLEWLKTQPAQFQDSVLGKTKGKIFRNSGVSVDKFSSMLVDRVGKPLTIKDMAAKDKMIEEYLQSAR